MSTIIQNIGLKLVNGLATLTWPDGTLKPSMWSSAAADVFQASKLQVPRFIYTNFDLAIGTTPPVAREEIVYVAGAAGTINKFAAALNDTGTSTDIDFVLKKNDAEIMASDLTITHAVSDRVIVEGSLDSVDYAAGDQFSIQMIVNSGADAHGPIAFLELLEILS